VKTDLTVALDLRRQLIAAAGLHNPWETVRLRVRSSLVRLLREEAPDLLPEVECRLKISLDLLEDDTLPPMEYEIL
jgi:hypothetical protein